MDTKESNVSENKTDFSDLNQSNNVWIFQANPNRYDILNALADNEIGEEKHWLVNQYKREISKGDIGLIWLSGKEGGIYAIAEIISNPEKTVPSEKEEKYWIDSDDKNKSKLRVKMIIKFNLLNNPIKKEDLRKTVGLESLSIFKQSQGTNFRVTKSEWEIIKKKFLTKD